MLKIKILLSALGLILSFALASSALPALAVNSPSSGGGSSTTSSSVTSGSCAGFSGSKLAQCQNCNSDKPDNVCVCYPEYHSGNPLTRGQKNSCITCNKSNNDYGSQAQQCLQSNVIVKDLNTIVDVLAGLVGVASVVMIIVGGIRYSLAGNNPQAVGAARKHIINAVFAMVSFMLIWALLQYLIPGGVFKNS